MPDMSLTSSVQRSVTHQHRTPGASPVYVGRFELLRQLGQGGQATVWLAQDPRLERQVAIKLLRPILAQDASALEQWLREARLVGRLAHPYIVPVFEADVQDDQPYLVFEYVQGQTLAELIARQGRCTPYDAVSLMVDVLDALQAAHAAGIVHRDLKPANIMVDSQRHARVMDFGMATALQAAPESVKSGGTPAYLAPEVLDGAAPSVAMDIYAAGLVLAEMLTGKPLVEADTNWQLLYKLANGKITLPEKMGVDDVLRSAIERALVRNPADRYTSAQAFKETLQAWMTPASAATPSSNAALDFLLRRMRHKSDFPALSDSVVRIQRVASSDDDSISDLTHEILKDVALTNKLLRMVNSVQFAQVNRDSVSTVSRAVSLAGFNAVRNMALSLVLLDHMQDKTHASKMLEDFMRSMMAGSIAAELCYSNTESEEAFLGALFQNLGRMLCTFYFAEEAQHIRTLVEAEKIKGGESAAALQVLGLSFEDLGLGVARVWSLPDSLQRCMRVPEGAAPSKATTGIERLQWVSVAANEVATAMLHSEPQDLDGRLAKIADQYGRTVGVTATEMTAATSRAQQKIVALAQALDIKVGGQALVSRFITVPVSKPPVSAVHGHADQEPDSLEAHELRQGAPKSMPAILESQAQSEVSVDQVVEVLSAGIQDITNAMVEQFQLNDILRMILETMLRGLGFRCLVLCLRDPKTNVLTGRFGLGTGSDGVVKSIKVPLQAEGDLFAAVCKKGADTLINDAAEPRMHARLPVWYTRSINAPSFLLLPLQMKGQPFALIYADQAHANGIVVNDKVLGLLRTLRNQAVMAFRQAGG